MNYCEKRYVRHMEEENYRLNDREFCLANTQRTPETNFWFLLEQGHNNIGDIAIGVAEQTLFEKYFPQVTMHFIYEQVFARYRKEISRQIQPRDVIILRGGGSIGNTVMHEKRREEIIRRFKDNLIISMPQTMCFPNGEKGDREKRRAAKIYTSNPNLVLIAREEQSYHDMCETFPHTRVLLTPDTVMTMDFQLPTLRRRGILLCFRSDWEKSLTDGDKRLIENASVKLIDAIQHTDMYDKERFVPFENRRMVLQNKIDQFKSASLVITDRLHGMVFSAITGTPCIALSNYNHKVEQTYKWLQNLPYICYCRTAEEAAESISKLYNCTATQYSNEFSIPYFDRLANIINAYCSTGKITE